MCKELSAHSRRIHLSLTLITLSIYLSLHEQHFAATRVPSHTQIPTRGSSSCRDHILSVLDSRGKMPPFAREADAPTLDPPREFTFTDLVVQTAVPRLAQEDSAEIAADDYLKALWQEMLGILESYIGKNRCYFTFLADDSVAHQSPEQIKFTNLNAFHEVRHWPGASAQLKWTSFVLATIEYHTLSRENGPNLGLPSTASPCAQLRSHT